MRIFADTASLAEIEEWDSHPWVFGFTTNPTLFRAAGVDDPWEHARTLAKLTRKPLSIDGPEEVWELGSHIYRKVVRAQASDITRKLNVTAVCSLAQMPERLNRWDVLSVFAGRIMDTGRDPRPVIDAAKRTGAQVLWASVREPYNIVQAEQYGCDIVTVPPAILAKYLDWRDRPLELVAFDTIAQFERDASW